MLDLLCRAVEKIVFTGINGVALIPLIGFIFHIFIGQARDFITVAKQILREGR